MQNYNVCFLFLLATSFSPHSAKAKAAIEMKKLFSVTRNKQNLMLWGNHILGIILTIMCNLVLEGGLIQEIFGKINTFFPLFWLSVAESDISLRNLCQEKKPQNHGKSCRYHEDIKWIICKAFIKHTDRQWIMKIKLISVMH